MRTVPDVGLKEPAMSTQQSAPSASASASPSVTVSRFARRLAGSASSRLTQRPTSAITTSSAAEGVRDGTHRRGVLHVCRAGTRRGSRGADARGPAPRDRRVSVNTGPPSRTAGEASAETRGSGRRATLFPMPRNIAPPATALRDPVRNSRRFMILSRLRAPGSRLQALSGAGLPAPGFRPRRRDPAATSPGIWSLEPGARNRKPPNGPGVAG